MRLLDAYNSVMTRSSLGVRARGDPDTMWLLDPLKLSCESEEDGNGGNDERALYVSVGQKGFKTLIRGLVLE